MIQINHLFFNHISASSPIFAALGLSPPNVNKPQFDRRLIKTSTTFWSTSIAIAPASSRLCLASHLRKGSKLLRPPSPPYTRYSFHNSLCVCVSVHVMHVILFIARSVLVMVAFLSYRCLLPFWPLVIFLFIWYKPKYDHRITILEIVFYCTSCSPGCTTLLHPISSLPPPLLILRPITVLDNSASVKLCGAAAIGWPLGGS